MRKLFSLAVVLRLALPISLLADLNGSTTLAADATFNLNAGDTPGCAPDLVWAGNYLGPQGNAPIFVVPGTAGPAEFDSFACNVAATAGQFTIPPYVLAPFGSLGGTGTLSVQISTYPQAVSASGLDAAFLFGYVIPQTSKVLYY